MTADEKPRTTGEAFARLQAQISNLWTEILIAWGNGRVIRNPDREKK